MKIYFLLQFGKVNIQRLKEVKMKSRKILLIIFLIAIIPILGCISSSKKIISQQVFTGLAPTPPMGWNSWDSFGMDITEEQIKAVAGYMVKNMKKSGWEYIVLDMGWYYGEGLNTNNFRMINPPQYIDEYGRLIPSLRKFPSASNGQGLKSLSDYIHSLGLKFGIHIMRGIPRQAVDNNTIVKGTKYRAKDFVSYSDTASWYHGMYGIDMTKPGAREYYNSLIELYSEWGVDYIKADDMIRPYHREEIEGVSTAIKKANRPIVLSLSAGPSPVTEIKHFRANANLWRISGDLWDDWKFLKPAFDVSREWQSFVQPNHWPDLDMLPLGKLRINGTDGMLAEAIKKRPEETFNEYSRLTNDEKYTLLTLWIIFRSPLMMGGNLLENDEFTLQLLTNNEVLAINQNSKNNHELKAIDDKIVWVADDPDSGAKYVALFNTGDQKNIDIEVTWDELGISGDYNVRDLWKKKNIDKFSRNFSASIPPHGAGLFKLFKF
jgi:alpha-galactosidase